MNNMRPLIDLVLKESSVDTIRNIFSRAFDEINKISPGNKFYQRSLSPGDRGYTDFIRKLDHGSEQSLTTIRAGNEKQIETLLKSKSIKDLELEYARLASMPGKKSDAAMLQKFIKDLQGQLNRGKPIINKKSASAKSTGDAASTAKSSENAASTANLSTNITPQQLITNHKVVYRRINQINDNQFITAWGKLKNNKTLSRDAQDIINRTNPNQVKALIKELTTYKKWVAYGIIAALLAYNFIDISNELSAEGNTAAEPTNQSSGASEPASSPSAAAGAGAGTEAGTGAISGAPMLTSGLTPAELEEFIELYQTIDGQKINNQDLIELINSANSAIEGTDIKKPEAYYN